MCFDRTSAFYTIAAMNGLEGLFKSTIGIELTTMRNVWIVCLASFGMLYVYRLSVIIRCMATKADFFKAPIDRLIWVALALLVPLGIGAYLYDLVQVRKPWKPSFLLPFGVIAFCFVFYGLPMILKSTSFKFDFLGS